jgi:nucleoside-diphosphate-sugar epimerase
LFTQVLSKDELLVGNLTPTRDLTFVTDTVDGFMRVAACGASVGRDINLGTGRDISIGDLVHKIVALAGRDIPVRQSAERMRPATSEVERLCSDNSLAHSLLGWQPRVSLEEGLSLTFDWVKKHTDFYSPNQYRV